MLGAIQPNQTFNTESISTQGDKSVVQLSQNQNQPAVVSTPIYKSGEGYAPQSAGYAPPQPPANDTLEMIKKYAPYIIAGGIILYLILRNKK